MTSLHLISVYLIANREFRYQILFELSRPRAYISIKQILPSMGLSRIEVSHD